MADWYTLRDDAPDWVRDAWPDETMTYWDDCGPVHACDLPDDLFPHADAWELVASYDHELRCADETMVCEIATLASIIMRPVLAYMIGADDYATDPYAAACKELDYSGDGWAEPTDDDPNAERVHWLHGDVIRHRNYDQCNDVMVETSSDAGMTWLLVRESAPTGSEGD